MKNLLPTLKNSISMNREIYEFEQSWEQERQEQIELVDKAIEQMNTLVSTAFAGFQRGQTAPIILGPDYAFPSPSPIQFGRQYGRQYGRAGITYSLMHQAFDSYEKERAIQAIKVKYQGNRSERRSKNKKNNNTFNERPKTLEDVIKQKQNRVRYSFNSTNISDKFSNNKYDKGLNNKW